MTLLQITAIEVDDAALPCCRGTIHHAAIGRGRGPIDADEIFVDLEHGANSYFAQIDGRLVDVAVACCATCGAPSLTTPSAVDVGNELLRLPTVEHEAPAPEPVRSQAPPRRGNWRERLLPHQRVAR